MDQNNTPPTATRSPPRKPLPGLTRSKYSGEPGEGQGGGWGGGNNDGKMIPLNLPPLLPPRSWERGLPGCQDVCKQPADKANYHPPTLQKCALFNASARQPRLVRGGELASTFHEEEEEKCRAGAPPLPAWLMAGLEVCVSDWDGRFARHDSARLESDNRKL